SKDHQSRFLNRDHLMKAHALYEKYGGPAIIVARFVPIVRTFAPFVAGVGTMTYSAFFMYNDVSAIDWALGVIDAGLFTGTRRFAGNLLFVLLVLGLIAAFFAGGPKVPGAGALVLNLKGDLVEQLTAQTPSGMLNSVISGAKEETLLKDVLDALAAAKEDKRI